MPEDRRRIQTAVLGDADSDEPLLLPLEAIELSAFRRRHQDDTYWCGLLLGGCGGRLTTKLYTDRVCHFSHLPDPDGAPHVCGRHARGVSSADHLYVRSATAAWLEGRGDRADFTFARPDGAPIGSVVDIRWRDAALRVHLDREVPPRWDQGHEPVLGVSVPVDRDTLVRHRYVHRIRLDSEGTTRRVRIGTEEFARPVEWFGLDECATTEHGLSTPAVERIVRSRRTPPPLRWPTGAKARKGPDPHARAQSLLRRLAEARKIEAVVEVHRVCYEIRILTGVDDRTRERLTSELADARAWLDLQIEVRRALFSRLAEATTGRDAEELGVLLVRANATAGYDRNDEETRIADAAADRIAALREEGREAQVNPSRRVQAIIDDLRLPGRSLSPTQVGHRVEQLVRAATEAGSFLAPRQVAAVAYWKSRAALDRTTSPAATSPSARAGGERRPTRKRTLQEQVARRFWIKETCPLCLAGKGRECVNVDPIGTGQARPLPHDERLRPILDERKARVLERDRASSSRPRRPDEVACPDCASEPGATCTTRRGPHRARVERARELTRRQREPREPGP
ncbi:hypothetical protein ACFZBU_39490 [Embleya sp. NPDC008237]|uniref:zinc finger domain-containing protein n=1 Tax=Embleya sp. NPDC008237 TaxID=3363978 RepID=UPI0036F146DD